MNTLRETVDRDDERCLVQRTPSVTPELARHFLEELWHWREGNELGAIRVEASPVGQVVLKHEFEHGWKGVVGVLGGREPRLVRAFRIGLLACSKGLRTPEPLLVIRCEKGLRLECLLVMRHVEGDDPWLRVAAVRSERRTLLADLAREIARWHAAGLRHRDLKAPNLLYDSRRESRGPWILDLVGAHEVGHPSLAMRARDLGRLRASARAAEVREDDWALFRDAYVRACAELGTPVANAGRFEQAIERWASKKLARNRRRRRPLA